MLEHPSMDWRRLMNYTVIRFMCVLRKNGIQTEDENSCVIIDDTTLQKSGKFIEHITKIFDHVKRNYVLGYKLLLCAFGGIGKKQFRRRFSLHREKDNPDYQRELECGMSKLDCTVEMVKRMWKCGLHLRYALADSWFACEDFISFIRKIANGAIHYVGLAKMGATKYVINGKKHNAGELVALYSREYTHACRKYKCQYIALRGDLGNLPNRIFLIKYGHNERWNIMLSTDISMSFVRAFELYQIRRNIEVVNRETKEYLGLGAYAGRNLNGQIADATLCYITYTVMALEKRMADYETPWASCSLKWKTM